MNSIFERAERHQFVPGAAGLTITGGSGSWLHTADGRRILDAGGGAIVSNIGHGRTEVADAVAASLRSVDYALPGWQTEDRLRLHDVLVERWLPAGFEHVFFAGGGSEAADSSLRLARAYQLAKGRPGRWKVVGRHPSYHGITLGALGAASHDSRRAAYEPMLPQFPKVSWNDPADVERVIAAEDPDTIAGFIFEPVTGAAGGCLSASQEYWQVVQDLCRRHDILLIADEVMTGLGRTGACWGHEHIGVVPDVIYGSKGLGGGYVPISMVATTIDVAGPLAGLPQPYMYFTYTGASAMCAGAVAVLDIMERERLLDRVGTMGAVLERRLRMELGDHPNVKEIRGSGLFYGVELARDGHRGELFSRDRGVATRVVGDALAHDVWVYPAGSGPVHDAVMLGCPFVVTESEIDTMVTTLRAAIDRVVAEES